MNHPQMLAACQTSNATFRQTWIDVCNNYKANEAKWVAMLKEKGYKAAHPDDGWVNRVANEVRFVYPQFKYKLQPGDLVALGNSDRFRTVIITGSRPFFHLEDTYIFEPLTINEHYKILLHGRN
jgi:hypothetical protein